MNKSEHHIEQLTPELIDKYLKGSLSHAEMHAVEKLMLESEFEAEAMEGFEQAGADVINNDLKTLHDRLNKRVTTSRVIPLWFKVAASLIVLALTTFLILQVADTPMERDSITMNEAPESEMADESITTPEESEEEIAEDQITEESFDKKTLDKPPAIERPPISASAVEKDDKDVQQTEIVALETKGGGAGMADTIIISDLNTDYALIEIEEDEFVERLQFTPVEEQAVLRAYDQHEDVDKAEEESLSRVLRSKAAGVEAKKSKSIDNKRIITGKVTSADDNSGLPGINVILKGTTVGTVTDIDGNYSLEVPDDKNQKLTFSFIGLQATDVSLDSQKEINVVMENDVTELSEVVITAQGIEREKRSLGYSVQAVESIQQAEPESGRSAYKSYLKNNSNYPSDSRETGKVVVKFVVTETGSLKDFEVTRSMGDKFDQEAIRLIKEGPKWKPARRDGVAEKDTVKVKVKFEKED